MKRIEIEAGGIRANITVHEATTWMAMRRGQLAADVTMKDAEDILLWFARRFMYPDCLACSEGEIGGRAVDELSFEEYMALPDRITEAWLSTVYEINPHWQPRFPSSSEESEEQAKKALMLSDG